jgi:transposase-like protein
MKKQFTPKEKAAIALEAIRELKTPAQIASDYEVHPVSVGTWKKQLTENASKIFSQKNERDDQQKTIDELYRIIGQREAELSWLKKKLGPFKSP